jgi:hypothetical protein
MGKRIADMSELEIINQRLRSKRNKFKNHRKLKHCVDCGAEILKGTLCERHKSHRTMIERLKKNPITPNLKPSKLLKNF